MSKFYIVIGVVFSLLAAFSIAAIALAITVWTAELIKIMFVGACLVTAVFCGTLGVIAIVCSDEFDD
jgi:hypothetical protein